MIKPELCNSHSTTRTNCFKINNLPLRYEP